MKITDAMRTEFLHYADAAYRITEGWGLDAIDRRIFMGVATVELATGQGTNVESLYEGIRMSRETVRRRVNRLINDGHLRRIRSRIHLQDMSSYATAVDANITLMFNATERMTKMSTI